jgi:hypothetical protein
MTEERKNSAEEAQVIEETQQTPQSNNNKKDNRPWYKKHSKKILLGLGLLAEGIICYNSGKKSGRIEGFKEGREVGHHDGQARQIFKQRRMSEEFRNDFDKSRGIITENSDKNAEAIHEFCTKVKKEGAAANEAAKA